MTGVTCWGGRNPASGERDGKNVYYIPFIIKTFFQLHICITYSKLNLNYTNKKINRKNKKKRKKNHMNSKAKKRETIFHLHKAEGPELSLTRTPLRNLYVWGVGYHMHFVAAEFCTCAISHIGLKTPKVPVTCTVDSLHSLYGHET